MIWMFLWIATSMIGYAGMCAEYDHDAEHMWPHTSDRRRVRQDMWFCGMYNAFPFVGPIIELVTTAGFQDGFRWNVRPSTRFGGPPR